MSCGILEKKKKRIIYVEQLERTKDDGDVEVMSAQSVCDLIEIEVLLIAVQNEKCWEDEQTIEPMPK